MVIPASTSNRVVQLAKEKMLDDGSEKLGYVIRKHDTGEINLEKQIKMRE